MPRIKVPGMEGVEVGGKTSKAGFWVFRIENAEQKLSKSGNPKISVRYRCTEPGENEGASLFDDCSLQPQALFRLKELIEASGIEYTADPDGSWDFEITDLIGKEVIIKVEDRLVEDKVYPQAKSISVVKA